MQTTNKHPLPPEWGYLIKLLLKKALDFLFLCLAVGEQLLCRPQELSVLLLEEGRAREWSFSTNRNMAHASKMFTPGLYSKLGGNLSSRGDMNYPTSYRAEMELEMIICMKSVTKLGRESKSPESQFRGFLHNTHEGYTVNENTLWGR